MRRLADLGELSGRRVLVRCDLNVPIQDGRITDDGRIRAALPTIRELAARGARVLVCSHLGRPTKPDPALSLAPVGARLAALLGAPVEVASDVLGPSAQQLSAGLAAGSVGLLENVRFEPGEVLNDEYVARGLAALADSYVGDAFGAVHRAHASVVGVPALLPHAAGGLVLAELAVLRRLTESPARPYAVVLGGSKVSDKLAVMEALLARADRILLGGGMCFTFLAAQGLGVGRSLCQLDALDAVRRVLTLAEEKATELGLPVDVVVAASPDDAVGAHAVPVAAIPDDAIGL
ncbi:MAG: phosphoglycerate kinase, partial [Mycobacteriales bacterium]